MSRSLSHVGEQPSGAFDHRESGTHFSVASGKDGARITLSRDGLSAAYSAAYVIGSGKHAAGNIIRVGQYLFQSPIAFYSRRGQWDMAPGYETATAPDFTRPVTEECLNCHAGRAVLARDTVNRFEPIQTTDEAIGCDRCHGDTAAHLAHPGRDTIVNPARLPMRARNSVCEQCHLIGEVRILNPGKRFSDFHAGQNLEDTYSVYVRGRPDTDSKKASIKVISHVEQLNLSVCARKSEGKLWCGTCHNPHETPEDKVSYFRNRCLSCHGQALLARHAKPVDNCVGCHMPARKAKDGAHTAFTDHLIARFPRPDEVNAEPAEEVTKLVPWQPETGAFAQRNLGLANIEMGQRQHSTGLLQEGAGEAVTAMKSLPPDPAILTKLGLVLLQSGEASDAIEPLEFALRLEPGRAGSHINVAKAYRESGQEEKAIAELNRAIEVDPSAESAYEMLGEIYAAKHDVGGIVRTFQLYLQFMPQNMMARKTISGLQSRTGK